MLPRKTALVVAVFVVILYVNRGQSASSNGQKAHFQVEDKSGDLKVIATKDMAKVTSQADSVQVVVKPGMADYPVVKSDKPIVHVTNGCCGWNTLSFRKSLILKGSKTFGEKAIGLKNQIAKRRQFAKERAQEGQSLRFVNKKPANKKSILHTNFRNAMPLLQKKLEFIVNKNKKSKKKHYFNEKSLNPSRIPQTSEEKPAKKSSFQSGEVGFAVTGTAGKLNMDVTKVGTKVSSESGLLDVFLKRKASPSNGAVKDSVHANRHEIVHIAPDLVKTDDIGLRKSNVPLTARSHNLDI